MEELGGNECSVLANDNDVDDDDDRLICWDSVHVFLSEYTAKLTAVS